jgi:hypothetical protein
MLEVTETVKERLEILVKGVVHFLCGSHQRIGNKSATQRNGVPLDIVMMIVMMVKNSVEVTYTWEAGIFVVHVDNVSTRIQFRVELPEPDEFSRNGFTVIGNYLYVVGQLVFPIVCDGPSTIQKYSTFVGQWRVVKTLPFACNFPNVKGFRVGDEDFISIFGGYTKNKDDECDKCDYVDQHHVYHCGSWREIYYPPTGIQAYSHFIGQMNDSFVLTRVYTIGNGYWNTVFVSLVAPNTITPIKVQQFVQINGALQYFWHLWKGDVIYILYFRSIVNQPN